MVDRRVKSVLVWFGGGDSSGMNAFLRGFVRIGLNRHSARILGCKDGFKGLLHICGQIQCRDSSVARVRDDIETFPGRLGLWRKSQTLVRMDHDCVRGLTVRGGTVLGTARWSPFREPFARKQAIDLLDELDIDAVVICGGNGSADAAAKMASESALQVVFIPATIDNDVLYSETALGFDTAVNAVAAACEHANDTAASHHRIMVLEVMGRESGELARMAALAGGAEIVITPERGALHVEKMRNIANRLEKSMTAGRDHGIVLIAEGVKLDPPAKVRPAAAFVEYLESHFRRPGSPFADLEVRLTVLGHVQRGGKPTAADRILAARFAEASWETISKHTGHSGVIGQRQGRLVLQPFNGKCPSRTPKMSNRLYEAFKAISK